MEATPTEPSADKQNEACVACRSVKRKCINSGDKSTCTRCSRLNLECVYKQEKRGRKAVNKSEDESGTPKPKKARPPSAIAPAKASTPRSTGVGTGSDWLYSDLTRIEPGLNGASHDPSNANAHTQPYNNFASTSRMDALSSVSSAAQSSIAPHHHTNADPVASSAQQPLLYTATLPHPSPLPRTGFTPHNAPSPNMSHHQHPISVSRAESLGSGSGISPPAHNGVGGVPVAAPVGGFSLNKLLSARPGGAAEGQARSHSIAAVFSTDDSRDEDGRAAPSAAKAQFVGVTELDIIPISSATNLFNFYFTHQNDMMSLLDPAFHTVERVCKDAILWSSILTVAAKVALPKVYPAAVAHCRKLLGQAFEHGTMSIELIQAIALLVFWCDAQDDAGARRLAYALRGAFELGLNKRATEIPQDEMEARAMFNRERTWIYISIADHRFSTQRSTPRMIPATHLRHDVPQWIVKHALSHPCPSEAGLAPLTAMGRLLDLYEPVSRQPVDDQLLAILEADYAAWTSDWAGEETRIPLQAVQSSFIRFYAKVFRFQLDEVHLIVAIAKSAAQEQSSQAKSIVAFKSCVRAALGVLEMLRDVIASALFVWESAWIGSSSTAVWLAANIGGMTPEDRAIALQDLTATQQACERFAKDDQTSMAAYTARLLAHWIGKIEPQPVATGADGGELGAVAAQPFSRPFVTASLNSNFFDSTQWTAQQQQPGMWTPDFALPGAATPMSNGGGGAVDGVQSGLFFNSIMPPGAVEHDFSIYPVDDGALWQSFFPTR